VGGGGRWEELGATRDELWLGRVRARGKGDKETKRGRRTGSGERLGRRGGGEEGSVWWKVEGEKGRRKGVGAAGGLWGWRRGWLVGVQGGGVDA